MMKRSLLALAMIALATPALAAMTGNEIRDELIGPNLKFQNGGISGTAKYSKNGAASMRMSGGSVTSDTGTWQIRGSQLCLAWQKLRGGQSKCFSVTKTGARSYLYSNGTKVQR